MFLTHVISIDSVLLNTIKVKSYHLKSFSVSSFWTKLLEKYLKGLRSRIDEKLFKVLQPNQIIPIAKSSYLIEYSSSICHYKLIA